MAREWELVVPRAPLWSRTTLRGPANQLAVCMRIIISNNNNNGTWPVRGTPPLGNSSLLLMYCGCIYYAEGFAL